MANRKNSFIAEHLPNVVSAGWLWGISPGIGANEKRRNILN